MSESEHDYFTRRAVEERAAAESAEHPEAERSHLELAHRYEAAAAASLGMPIVQLRVSAAGGPARRG